jgi:YD repeat-containing protein
VRGENGKGNLTLRTRIASAQADDYTTAYQWDYRNRLVAVIFMNEAGATTKSIDYTYDPFDRLIGKTVQASGTETRQVYVYDGDNVALEFDGAGSGSLSAGNPAGRGSG